jgi:hypothetical protein
MEKIPISVGQHFLWKAADLGAVRVRITEIRDVMICISPEEGARRDERIWYHQLIFLSSCTPQ